MSNDLDSFAFDFFDLFLRKSFQDVVIENLEQYEQIFEKKFQETKTEIAVKNILDLSEEQIKEIRDCLFKVYINKCSYQKKAVTKLEDPKHEEWLSKQESIQWNQWNAYEKYLLKEKKFCEKNIKEIGKLADTIVDRLENPLSTKEIKVKGLLMGEVQSGKTASFMAVLHKAIDVGWKFIIVLSGLTDDLRFQTQQRLNSNLIGYTLSKKSDRQNFGIREKIRGYDYVTFYPLTTLDKDFAKSACANILKGEDSGVYIAVCKKNSKILNNLFEWLGGVSGKYKDRKVIAEKIPCLIVDDEADQASPNTNKDEEEATAVNNAIRNLLDFFQKSSYLAVTATPYANIFINPQFKEDGKDKLPDLFPRNFIYIKPSPTGYTGVEELFGEDPEKTDCVKNELEQKVVITIPPKQEEIFKEPIKKGTKIDKLPPSLIEAIRYFFCCCAFKEITTDGHLSMLAHIDYRKDNHKIISDLITEFYKSEFNSIELEQGLDLNELSTNDRFIAYKKIWEQGCQSEDSIVHSETLQELSKEKFINIWRNNLLKAIDKVRIETINSDYKGEKLTKIYEDVKNAKMLLIGGYALSRGVTIEGLCVTYLSRKSSTVDTLLQMGRFFGYRGFDIKIMKIWLSKTIKKMYEEASNAQKEFVEQVKIMNDNNQTPTTFGFKIRKAPANLKLRVAAKNKMYHSKTVTLDVNIAGHPLHCSKLPVEQELLQQNIITVKKFIESIGESEESEKNNDIVWNNIDSEKIANLVADFNSYGWGDINRADISKFIKDKLSKEKWTVTLLSNTRTRTSHSKLDLFGLGKEIVSVPSRIYVKDQGKKFFYFDHGAIMRGQDLTRRLNDEERKALLDENNKIDNYDYLRNKAKLKLNPQLIIYSVDPVFNDSTDPKLYKNLICGLGIGVPCTNDLERTELKMNYEINDTYEFNLSEEVVYE